MARGRASVYRNKEGGQRVQGVLTPEGFAAFEQKREELREWVEHLTGATVAVSDADVIEYLARGGSKVKLKEYLESK